MNPSTPPPSGGPATGGDRDWQTAPDGLYCIDHSTTAARTPVLNALAYAFWRIQAQPLAATARPPLDRAVTRRAARASVVHGTRIVMLRRLHTTEPGPGTGTGDARWHYTVRFVVRGHWRHLRDRDGNPTASGYTPTSKLLTALSACPPTV